MDNALKYRPDPLFDFDEFAIPFGDNNLGFTKKLVNLKSLKMFTFYKL